MGLAKPQIDLLPWDPNSKEHVERLYQQRVACGWNKDAVDKWCGLQRDGQIALHWVVSPLLYLHVILSDPQSRSSPTPIRRQPPNSALTSPPGLLNRPRSQTAASISARSPVSPNQKEVSSQSATSLLILRT